MSDDRENIPTEIEEIEDTLNAVKAQIDTNTQQISNLVLTADQINQTLTDLGVKVDAILKVLTPPTAGPAVGFVITTVVT